MNAKKHLSAIWLMAMALLSLGAYTAFFVAQMWLNALHALYLSLAVLQFATLIVHLWGPEKLTGKGPKILYRICYASSFLVIPTFCFIFMGLISQYHVRIPGTIDASQMSAEQLVPTDETTVYNNGTVYIIFPKYSQVDLVCDKRPSKSDKSITWCSAAAFQHTVSLSFSQEDIEGDHASCGEYYTSPYNKDAFAAFISYDGYFRFDFDNKEAAIKEAADAGGSGFMQFGLINDKTEVMNFDRPRARCYRALAELNGNLCIIDSVNMIHFTDFMDELKRIGVTNALYMDMGAGWNYSWYRNAAENVVTLFGLPVPWSHNWVVFRS